jgi:hypothetical protein
MMPAMVHQLQAEREILGEVLFACRTCTRSLVVEKQTGRVTVLDSGDMAHVHTGGLGPVELAATVVP